MMGSCRVLSILGGRDRRARMPCMQVSASGGALLASMSRPFDASRLIASCLIAWSGLSSSIEREACGAKGKVSAEGCR